MVRNCVGIFGAALMFTVIGAAEEVPPVQTADGIAFFENHVRPVLVRRCIGCHGPKKSESGLRLDTRATALAGGDSGPAVVPMQPEQSLLIQAVQHKNDMEMPPDDRLEGHEIAALVRWVQSGAVWPDDISLGSGGPKIRGGPITTEEQKFWSLQPIMDPQPPRSVDSSWVLNDVDRFVLARLKNSRLMPNPLADRRTLIRRVTFDLTGLPPTPDEVQAFLDDDSSQAFARVVDRLLGSQAYGERWGRHWLDVVRYADTAGETADYPTPLSWKYRNWVIDSLNEDKPYDQFLREQIAGDIFADHLEAISDEQYREMLAATGFVAISRRFGFDVENYYHLTIQDTIDTLGQAVLGLTLGCARCHDHKFDPVNMEDYYAWYGIFQSTRYSFPGSEEKKRPYDLYPDLPTSVAAQRKADYDAELNGLETEIASLELRRTALEHALRAVSDDAEIVSINPWKSYIAGRRLTEAVDNADSHTGFQVWRIDPLPMVGLNGSDATLKVPGTVEPGQLVVHPQTKEGVGIAWLSPFRGRVRIAGSVQDAHDCGDSIVWHIDHLSSQGLVSLASGECQTNGRQEFTEAQDGHLNDVAVRAGELIQLSVMPKTHYGCDLTQVQWTISEIDGDRTWNLVQDVAGNFLVGNPHADRLGNAETWTFFQVAEDRGLQWGRDNSLEITAGNVSELRQEMDRIVQRLRELTPRRDDLRTKPPYGFIYGAIESGQPADAHVQLRGEPKKLGDLVPRRNLEILGGQSVPDGSGSGRLQLAMWLTDSKNPLVARVLVNRIWQHHFGRGIVATENDFGARGQPPTHPELLDWLATRFVQSGWSIKAMHRLIVNSATYQQSAALRTPRSADPESRLLWRFSPRRLSAEEIRDAMLLVSGELDPTMGGEHPFPPVDSWGFTQHAPFYGVYPTNRRSIYLMQQRLKRHPFLALFDGADPNVSTAHRQLTTVPTQALYLMNNPFVHQRAAGFGNRLLAAVGDAASRVDRAYRIAYSRPASEAELSESLEFLSVYRATLRESGLAAEQQEPAAWAALARTLLIRNEFLYVD